MTEGASPAARFSPVGGGLSAAVDAALAALDAGALVADLAALVGVPSVTGDEETVMGVAAAQARATGLEDVELLE